MSWPAPHPKERVVWIGTDGAVWWISDLSHSDPDLYKQGLVGLCGHSANPTKTNVKRAHKEAVKALPLLSWLNTNGRFFLKESP